MPGRNDQLVVTGEFALVHWSAWIFKDTVNTDPSVLNG